MIDRLMRYDKTMIKPELNGAIDTLLLRKTANHFIMKVQVIFKQLVSFQ